MDKLIHFKNNFFNVRHIINVFVGEDYIVISTIDGTFYRFVEEGSDSPFTVTGYYVDSEKTQFLEDLQSFM